MLEIRKMDGNCYKVVFLVSGRCAATFHTEFLAKEWLTRNFPEYVQGTPQYAVRLATEKAVKIEKLNAQVGAKVWRYSA